MALRTASLRVGALREKVRKARPERMLRVASSQPALYKASSTSVVNSGMPVRTKVKSCSRSHGFGFSIFITLAFLLSFPGRIVSWSLMRTKIDFPHQVAGMIFWVPGRGPDAYFTPLAGIQRAKQSPPSVSIGYQDSPTQAFRVLHNLFDMLV